MKPRLPADLGAVYRDIITGYSGVCVAVNVTLTGSDRVMLQPKRINEDGNPDDGQWFDILSVERIGDGVTAHILDNLNASIERGKEDEMPKGFEVFEIDVKAPPNLSELIKQVESGGKPKTTLADLSFALYTTAGTVKR